MDAVSGIWTATMEQWTPTMEQWRARTSCFLLLADAPPSLTAQGQSVQPYVMNKWSLPLLIPFGLLLAAAAPFIGVAST